MAKILKPQAYIGITGFKEQGEIEAVSKQFLEIKVNEAIEHIQMFGLLSSSQKLKDVNRVGRQSPSLNELFNLASLVPICDLPMVHYHTENRNNLADEISQVFNHNNLYDVCQAVQINMAWPDVKQIEKIKQEFENMQIVLQLPRATLEDINHITKYKDLVDYCLIDPSGGYGKEIEAEHLKLVKNVDRVMSQSRIGIAGGLYFGNVMSIIDDTYKIIGKKFSIDAQGRLRSNDKLELDLNKTQKYIENAVEVISGHI